MKTKPWVQVAVTFPRMENPRPIKLMGGRVRTVFRMLRVLVYLWLVMMIMWIGVLGLLGWMAIKS